MTYSPTGIEVFNLEEGEKVLNSKLIKRNLDLIGQETKKLDDRIIKNSERDTLLESNFKQNEVSYKHNFLALW